MLFVQGAQVPQAQSFDNIVGSSEFWFAQDTETWDLFLFFRVIFAETVFSVEMGSPLHADIVSPMLVATSVVEVPLVLLLTLPFQRQQFITLPQRHQLFQRHLLPWSSLSTQHQQLPSRHLLPRTCVSNQHQQFFARHMLLWTCLSHKYQLFSFATHAPVYVRVAPAQLAAVVETVAPALAVASAAIVPVVEFFRPNTSSFLRDIFARGCQDLRGADSSGRGHCSLCLP